MSKKKKFGLSNQLTQGLADTVSIVENDEGKFRNSIIPLTRIEEDPENPRKLSLSLDDINQGVLKSDPEFNKKSIELSKIQGLANSINNAGLLNPITVYKYSDKYRIIAGACRFLACNLIGKKEIECRILQAKPTIFELRLMQWFENTQRNDLTLFERLENIKSIMKNYASCDDRVIKARHLQDVLKFSKSQASIYANVLNSPFDIYSLIKNERINNLDKAAFLVSLDQKEKINIALSLDADGYSLAQIKSMLNEKFSDKSKVLNSSSDQPQKKSPKISLGSVKDPNVIYDLLNAVITNPKYEYLREDLGLISNQQPDNALAAFKKLITILEKGTKV